LKKVLKKYTVLLIIATMMSTLLSAISFGDELVHASASGIFIRVNQVGYTQAASKTAIVLSSTNLSGVRYDIFNANNISVFNGTIPTASKGSWGDAGGANLAYSYALDFSSLNTVGSGYYIKINADKSPTFTISNLVYSSLADLSMQFFKVQRCGDTSPEGHAICHVPGTNSSIDGKPDGASSTLDFSGGWHDASDYIKFMSTIGHVTDVMLTTYIHHPEAFPDPASLRGALTEAQIGLDFIHKMWDNENQMLYMMVADGLDHDVHNDDLDSRSKTWPEVDKTIYGEARPVHPSPAGKGANLAGKAAAALALGAKIWEDPNGPYHDAELAESYLTAAKQIYTWGKARPGIAGDADEFYVDTDYKDDMAWAAAELYRATGIATYLTEAKSFADDAGEWYNKSNTTLNWSRAYHWANYEIASLDPTYKKTAASRMNNHLSLKKNYADGQFWNTSSEPRWGTYEAMSNNATEAMMYQELTGDTAYVNLAQQQIDFMLGKNPWGVSMLNGAGTTWFQNPRHRVTTLNRVNNPSYELRGAWSEGFETSAQYAIDQMDPLLKDQEDPNIVQFNDHRMIWHDNRRDYATNEVTISGNVAGMAMVAFMPGGAAPEIPDVPTGLIADSEIPAQINVTWNAVPLATGYDLEVDGTIVSNVSSPYVHSSLKAGSTHNYKVRAKNSGGAGAWSSIVSATTSSIVSTDYITNADAFIRDGVHATTNYGTSATIEVKGDPDEDYSRIGFVKFELNELSGPSIDSALLKLHVKSASAPTPVMIYGLTSGDEWVESGAGSISWNNQPSSIGAVLVGTMDVSAAGWYTIDATSYVKSQLSKGKKMTFKLQVENNNGELISFSSKETGSNKPVLTVTSSMDQPEIIAAEINPQQVNYDLRAPGDVSATIKWNSASSVTGVIYDGKPVTTLDGYVVTESSLTIKRDYLASLGLGKGNKAEFTISFDKGNPVKLTVNMIDSYVPDYSIITTDYITDGDAFIRDDTYADTNYGTAATIEVKGDPDEGYSRIGFVKFNLTELFGSSIESVLFKIYCNNAPDLTPVMIYGLTSGDEWIESGDGSITWNNQPSSTGAELVGTMNVSSAGWYTIDATSYVKSQLSEGKNMTFKLQVENNNGALMSFSSKENNSNKPVLTVNTLEDSATIDAKITPEQANYDLAAPGDMSATIKWNIASSVTGVVYDGKPVTAPDGYDITGSSLTIKRSYLASLGLGDGNKAEFTISFDKGNPAKFTVTMIDSSAPVSHSIRVKSGGLGGASATVESALRGTKITLTTTPMTGSTFKEWKVISPTGLDITDNTFIMPDEAVTVEAIFEGIPKENHPLTKVLGGYWTYWKKSAVRIRDIDPDYNLVYLFHAQPVGGAPGTTGAVYWTNPDNGRGAAANLVADIQYARNVQGRKAILTVGGANAGITFANRERSQNFIDSIVNIYDQLGGFDGIDWNNYEGSISASTEEMIWISLELKRMFPGFMITTPPAPWRAADLEFSKAMVQAGALDYAAPQYYDGPGLNDPSFVVDNIAKWVNALGAEHVVVGFGVSEEANYMTIDQVVTAWNQVKAKYPTIRGAFNWEIHKDESNGWEFANTLKPILSTSHSITVETEGHGTASANAASAEVNTKVKLDATPENGYRFKEWQVVSPEGLTIDGNTFTMPNEAVIVKAIFEEIPAANYILTPSTPAYTAIIKVKDASGNITKETTLPITVDEKTGTVVLDTTSMNNLLSNGGTSVITVPSIAKFDTYSVGIPVSYLSTANRQGALTVNTDTGSITVPSNMLTGAKGGAGTKAVISIGRGDKSVLPEAAKKSIGERQLIKLSMSIDGKALEWNNPNAPVTVTIPYTPSAEELINPESIIIWYIDGSGKAIAVPNGHYDAIAGTVTFTTNHFSYYAVAYHTVSFADVAADAWYNKAVGFVAARGITTGTGNDNYSPNAKLTRGEFLVMLMKAYQIAPDENQLNNFTDAGSTYYTGYLAAAKRLGIAEGIGNNRFAPDWEISRQEMFTLLFNALKAIDRLPQGNSDKTLSSFSDAGQIASWAKDAMSLLVETGTIGGSAGQLTPASTTIRAEIAQVLYNLLLKQ